MAIEDGAEGVGQKSRSESSSVSGSSSREPACTPTRQPALASIYRLRNTLAEKQRNNRGHCATQNYNRHTGKTNEKKRLAWLTSGIPNPKAFVKSLLSPTLHNSISSSPCGSTQSAEV